jgi:hypothetical protein
MVTITLDKERHMEYSLLGARELRKSTGKNFQECGSDLANEEILAAVIWALLLPEDPKLKVEDIFPYLKGRTLGLAMKAIEEAFSEISDPLGTGPSASTTTS